MSVRFYRLRSSQLGTSVDLIQLTALVSRERQDPIIPFQQVIDLQCVSPWVAMEICQLARAYDLAHII